MMTEEMRMKYIDFLDSKGCVSEDLQDIYYIKDGKMVKDYVVAKVIKSTPKLYVEFCKLNGLEVKDVFIFGDKLNTEDMQSVYCGITIKI